MSSLARSILLAVTIIVAFVVLSILIGFFLRIAVFIALIAFAYYWFMRAWQIRQQRRRWR